VREFTMKDAYSFDLDDSGLDASYGAMFQTYKRIFARCGVAVVPSRRIPARSAARVRRSSSSSPTPAKTRS